MGNPSYEQTAFEQGFEGLGDNEDDFGMSVSPSESEVVSLEEAVAQDKPQREDYETIADYEDAMEGYEYRLNQAREIEKDLTYKPSAFDFKMPSDEKLKKFSEATKELKQERQQVIRGGGVAGYGGPGARTSYVPTQSPYQITMRGPSTAELEKLLLQGLKTSSQMRLTGFRGPRIRGLFG